MFDLLKTGIDGLDSILGGGVRYPEDTAAFIFITGGPGTGKTLLALEMVTRAWLGGEDGSNFFYYSVEQAPENLYKKLQSDFEFYGIQAEVTALEQEVPHKLCLEAHTDRGRSRLILTHANPAMLEQRKPIGPVIDVDWILTEIENYRLAGNLDLVCIDNVGLLLTDLDYFSKRAALLETRRSLMSNRIHGIFVQEEADPRELRTPSPEEFSTDVLLRLSFLDQPGDFKARSLEIFKARHQYYYRGAHHFSIAGRGIDRNIYLGARSERGPGIHIYPSIAAQLSMARDSHAFTVPQRGNDPINMGHPDFLSSFQSETGPGAGSSTVLLAEPGTRYTYLALRFLAAGCANNEETLMISTKEDQEAIHRICQREGPLAGDCLGEDGAFDPSFHIHYLHPEFISPGKFTWDLLQMVGGETTTIQRMAFDNMYRLEDRFPLLEGQHFMIPAILDLLRYRGITPLIVDLVPPGSARGQGNFNPASYITMFDNVFHLYLEEDGGTYQPFLRILKSTANDFSRKPIPIDYQRK